MFVFKYLGPQNCYVCIVLASFAAWLRNYLQSSSVNNIIRDVDFCRLMHNTAGCYALFQKGVG